MNFKLTILGLGVVLLFTACSEKPKNEFYLKQDGKYFSGEEVFLDKKSFTIGSTKKDYSVVIAKNAIRNLADHKEIVKLNGTSGAWYPEQLPLYVVSDLLSDKDACDIYYGNQGKACQAFVKEKTRLGFRRHYAYTFAEYMISENEMKIEKLGRKAIAKLETGKYYLYFFRSEDGMGEVARAQRVTRMKIDFR